MSKDELCKRVADEFTSAVVKVFDNIPNMRQLDEFFSDGMAIATASIEAATWEDTDRVNGILRTGAYLSLGLSKEFRKLSDELEAPAEPEPSDEPGNSGEPEDPDEPADPGDPEDPAPAEETPQA